MIARRFLLYFLFAAGLAVATTIIFEIYSLQRAADRTVENQVLYAQSVARFVGGALDHEARAIRRCLEESGPDIKDGEKMAGRLQSVRRDSLDRAGVVLIDAGRSVVASVGANDRLPPPRLLYPALREAEAGEELVVTDFWTDARGGPHVALVLGHRNGGAWHAAVLIVRLDGEDFERLFRYFVIDENSRLQLLDSAGVVLFSTRAGERFRSAVHGTYFTDKVRVGEPAALHCHSCHVEGEEEPSRESEVTAVAPVPGTTWSVCVREGTSDLFAPIREIAYSSVGLVCVILGVFAGFYYLLSRRVLKPIGRLMNAAAGIAQGQPQGALALDFMPQDEFAMLARSLETLSHQARSSAVGAGGPESGARLSGDLQESLDKALGSVLEGLVRIRPVCCAILYVDEKCLPPGYFRAQGVELRAAGPPEKMLSRIGATRKTVSPDELRKLGVTLEGASDTRSLLIKPIRVLEGFWGQLWIGVSAAAEDMGPYLAPTLELVSMQIQHILLRTILYDQLRHEHAQKNLMLRHLLQAEEEERKRLSREIHDEPAQVLNALLLMLKTFPDADDPGAQKECLERARLYVERLLDETDRIIRRLRPAVLDDLGLVEAVRATGQELLERAGILFELDLKRPDGTIVPKDVEVVAYRVFHEAINNAARHAQASRVHATLEIGPDRIRASVEDDGRGMDLTHVHDASTRPHWGLLGMRERVVQLGGKISFESPPGGSMKIQFEIPMEPPKEDRKEGG